LNDIVTLKSGL